MKTTRFLKLVSLAIAVAIGVPATTMGATDQSSNIPPAPSPGANNTYKLKFVPPTAQVEKLAAAGVSEDVIKAYVANCPYAFNLTPDNIIHLQSIGVSGAVLTEMLNHDKALHDASTAMNPPVAPPSALTQPQPAQDPGMYPTNPQSTVSVQTIGTPDYQYYNDLAAYGNWNYDNGYGWGWQAYPWLGYAYYPWGWLGYGGWRYWPNRGWCWYPNRFHDFDRGRDFRGHEFGGRDFRGHDFDGRRFGSFTGNRFDGRFNRSFGGDRSFVGNRSFSGFHSGFSPAMGRSFNSGAHFSGGHAGGFGGGHSGGFGGGHGGGGGHR